MPRERQVERMHFDRSETGGRPGGRPRPPWRGTEGPDDRAGRGRPHGPTEGRPASGAGRSWSSAATPQGGPRRGPRPPGGPWDRPRPARSGPAREGDRPAPPRYGAPDTDVPSALAPEDILAADEEVVAGRRPVEEAFAARRPARRLLVVPGRRAALDRLVLHATTLRIPVVEVEGGTLTVVSGFEGHQGIALVVTPRRWATLDEALALAKARAEPPLLLVLDHLEDPQNVGTLLRSAEAAGVHGVFFPTRGSAPLSPAAIKSSAGATEHLLLVPVDDLPAALVDLHTRGVRVVGADGDAPMTVREVDLRGPLAVVVGSEGRGLDVRVRRRVDVMARIPMRGRIASLNASVAGSLFLFEAAAQRAPSEDPLEDDSAMPEHDVLPADGERVEVTIEPADTPTDLAPRIDADSEDHPDALLPEAPQQPSV
jgi:23S rRNA (guanosine2251-2'-O)-methyltransferase